jgi:hypothetical protein
VRKFSILVTIFVTSLLSTAHAGIPTEAGMIEESRLENALTSRLSLWVNILEVFTGEKTRVRITIQDVYEFVCDVNIVGTDVVVDGCVSSDPYAKIGSAKIIPLKELGISAN